MKDFLAIRMKKCHEVKYNNILLNGSRGVVNVRRRLENFRGTTDMCENENESKELFNS